MTRETGGDSLVRTYRKRGQPEKRDLGKGGHVNQTKEETQRYDETQRYGKLKDDLQHYRVSESTCYSRPFVLSKEDEESPGVSGLVLCSRLYRGPVTTTVPVRNLVRLTSFVE